MNNNNNKQNNFDSFLLHYGFVLQDSLILYLNKETQSLPESLII